MTEVYNESKENIKIYNHINGYLLSIDYQYTDMKKMVEFFNLYPKFWYDSSSHHVYYDSQDILDVRNKIDIFKSIFVI